jgi:hypothetical protein
MESKGMWSSWRFRCIGGDISKKKGKEMMKRTCRISAISVILSGVVVLLSACATVPQEADLKESLRNSASVYWKMRMEGKFEETLKMEDEEVLEKANRGEMSLSDYYKAKAKIADNVQSFIIKDVQQLQGDKGRVDVEFTFIIPQVTQPFRQILTDEWVFKSGKWRHLFPVKGK